MTWEQFLDSNFFGALSGALITGLIAILINVYDNKRRDNEKNKEIKKRKSLLKVYTNDINMLLEKIITASKNRDSYPDPVTGEIDEWRRYHGPIPNQNQWDEYDALVVPYVQEIRESISDLYTVLEEMKHIDVNIMGKKEIIGIHKFKNAYIKTIEPLLKKQLNQRTPYISNENLKVLKEKFEEIQRVISK